MPTKVPLLFLAYIHDLPKNIVSSVKLYADDVLIYRTINSEQDHMILLQDLNMLQKWVDTWLMTFNPTKYKSICVSHKKILGFVTTISKTIQLKQPHM